VEALRTDGVVLATEGEAPEGEGVGSAVTEGEVSGGAGEEGADLVIEAGEGEGGSEVAEGLAVEEAGLMEGILKAKKPLLQAKINS